GLQLAGDVENVIVVEADGPFSLEPAERDDVDLDAENLELVLGVLFLHAASELRELVTDAHGDGDVDVFGRPYWFPLLTRVDDQIAGGGSDDQKIEMQGSAMCRQLSYDVFCDRHIGASREVDQCRLLKSSLRISSIRGSSSRRRSAWSKGLGAVRTIPGRSSSQKAGRIRIGPSSSRRSLPRRMSCGRAVRGRWMRAVAGRIGAPV